jgi:hypothetical protein
VPTQEHPLSVVWAAWLALPPKSTSVTVAVHEPVREEESLLEHVTSAA